MFWHESIDLKSLKSFYEKRANKVSEFILEPKNRFLKILSEPWSGKQSIIKVAIDFYFNVQEDKKFQNGFLEVECKNIKSEQLFY